MLPWDPSGKSGPKKPLPDHVIVQEPKEEVAYPAITATKDVPTAAAMVAV